MTFKSVCLWAHQKVFPLQPIKEAPSLVVLPSEIILQIFFYLKAKEGLACSLTCRQLNQIAMTESLWERWCKQDIFYPFPRFTPQVTLQTTFYARYKEAYILPQKEKDSSCNSWCITNFYGF